METHWESLTEALTIDRPTNGLSSNSSTTLRGWSAHKQIDLWVKALDSRNIPGTVPGQSLDNTSKLLQGNGGRQHPAACLEQLVVVNERAFWSIGEPVSEGLYRKTSIIRHCQGGYQKKALHQNSRVRNNASTPDRTKSSANMTTNKSWTQWVNLAGYTPSPLRFLFLKFCLNRKVLPETFAIEFKFSFDQLFSYDDQHESQEII